MVYTGGGGKPPPYAVGTSQPVVWFSVHTGGGTHRSRPTNYVGSPSGNVGRHLCVPPCGVGVTMTGAFRRTRTPCTNPPAGLRGRRPSHRNNAKHGLRTLPHFFRTTAPNHYKKLKIPNFKSFTRFFSCEGCPPPVCLWCSPTGGGQPKSRGPGGGAPGRASQGAKHPPVATGEIPAGRSQRNSRAAHGANSPR